MDLMRGQGRIQMLLAAEQEAQLIVAAARNLLELYDLECRKPIRGITMKHPINPSGMDNGCGAGAIWTQKWSTVKIARLRQAKEEAEREVESHQSHLEYQYQKGISEGTDGIPDSIGKGLEAQTEAKIKSLEESTSKASPEIVKMLLTSPRT